MANYVIDMHNIKLKYTCSINYMAKCLKIRNILHVFVVLFVVQMQKKKKMLDCTFFFC